MLRTYCYVLAACCVMGCGAHRAIPAAPTAPVATAASVMTVILKASWRPDSTVSFTVDKVIQAPGALKPNKSRGIDAAFIAYFTNSQGQVLDSCYVIHPLISRAESANEQGKLTTHMIKRVQGTANARVNYCDEFDRLLLRPLDKTSPQKEISLSLK